MPLATALAIGGSLAGIGQGVWNTLSSAHQNEKNRQFALQQQRLQNQFNLDMWNRQNAYNSPAAQVQRLMQAGLNPNLAYGQLGSGDAGFVQSADANYRGEAPQSNVDFQGAVQSVINNQRAGEIHDKQIEKMRLENEGIEYDNLLKKDLVDDLPEFKKYRAEKRAQEIAAANKNLEVLDNAIAQGIRDLILTDTKITGQELANDYQRLMNDFTEQANAIQVEQLLADLDLTYAEIDRVKAATQLIILQQAWQSYQNGIAELDYKDRKAAYDKGYNMYEQQYKKLSADTQAVTLANTYNEIRNNKEIAENRKKGYKGDGKSPTNVSLPRKLWVSVNRTIDVYTKDFGNILGGFGK